MNLPRHSGSSAAKGGRSRASGTYFNFRNRRVFVPDGYLVVGQITSLHGLRGELSVELHTDFPDRFQPGAAIFLGDALAPAAITQARPHKSNMLLRLEGIDTRDDAERLRGLWLYIAEEEAAELDEDAYWIHDIIGLTVVTDDGQKLGHITDVMPTGANDVYIIAPAPGITSARELLLPAISQVVQDVDLDAGTMIVHLLPGLVEGLNSDTESDTEPDNDTGANSETGTAAGTTPTQSA